MTGVAISVTIQDKGVQRAFEQLARIMHNTQPVMKAIGVGLVGSTHQRFISQRDPQGQPWKTLNQEYAKGKRNTRILTESGRLRNSINAQATSDEVRVGTNTIYAAAHQLGAEIKPKNGSHLMFRLGGRFVMLDSVTLPARPFLGISADDETMIAETVYGFIDRASNSR